MSVVVCGSRERRPQTSDFKFVLLGLLSQSVRLGCWLHCWCCCFFLGEQLQ